MKTTAAEIDQANTEHNAANNQPLSTLKALLNRLGPRPGTTSTSVKSFLEWYEAQQNQSDSDQNNNNSAQQNPVTTDLSNSPFEKTLTQREFYKAFEAFESTGYNIRADILKLLMTPAITARIIVSDKIDTGELKTLLTELATIPSHADALLHHPHGQQLIRLGYLKHLNLIDAETCSILCGEDSKLFGFDEQFVSFLNNLHSQFLKTLGHYRGAVTNGNGREWYQKNYSACDSESQQQTFEKQKAIAHQLGYSFSQQSILEKHGGDTGFRQFFYFCLTSTLVRQAVIHGAFPHGESDVTQLNQSVLHFYIQHHFYNNGHFCANLQTGEKCHAQPNDLLQSKELFLREALKRGVAIDRRSIEVILSHNEVISTSTLQLLSIQAIIDGLNNKTFSFGDLFSKNIRHLSTLLEIEEFRALAQENSAIISLILRKDYNPTILIKAFKEIPGFIPFLRKNPNAWSAANNIFSIAHEQTLALLAVNGFLDYLDGRPQLWGHAFSATNPHAVAALKDPRVLAWLTQTSMDDGGLVTDRNFKEILNINNEHTVNTLHLDGVIELMQAFEEFRLLVFSKSTALTEKALAIEDIRHIIQDEVTKRAEHQTNLAADVVRCIFEELNEWGLYVLQQPAVIEVLKEQPWIWKHIPHIDNKPLADLLSSKEFLDNLKTYPEDLQNAIDCYIVVKASDIYLNWDKDQWRKEHPAKRLVDVIGGFITRNTSHSEAKKAKIRGLRDALCNPEGSSLDLEAAALFKEGILREIFLNTSTYSAAVLDREFTPTKLKMMARTKKVGSLFQGEQTSGDSSKLVEQLGRQLESMSIVSAQQTSSSSSTKSAADSAGSGRPPMNPVSTSATSTSQISRVQTNEIPQREAAEIFGITTVGNVDSDHHTL